MPQSVNAYIENETDFAEVDRVKREIIRLYDDDFRKINPLGRGTTIFNSVPAELGYIYENVVTQMLHAAGHFLFYYTFKEHTEEATKPRSYEVDVVISRKDKICPIEVMSSGYKSHKSFDEFRRKFSSRIKERYLLYTKDLRKEADIILLPVYLAGLL